MVLDPIPQCLPVHIFGSRPQPPTSPSVYEESGYYTEPTVLTSRENRITSGFFLDLRVEFLLKTESGYLRDAEVT